MLSPHDVERDSPALAEIFEPESVAIVGASRNPAKMGHKIVGILRDHGYGGRILPINPAGGTIAGLPAYASLHDVPGGCDLAVLIVPGARAVGALADAVRAGARAAVVISSGFAETGAAGLELERELAAIAESARVALIGPNCEGIANNANGLFAMISGAMFERPAPAGGVSIVSQSGAYTGLIYRGCADQGVGVAKVVSTGNEAVVDVPAVLRYLRDDPDTTVVALHLEGVRDARAFRRAATALARVKPLVVNQVGRSAHAARVAATHTGVLATPGKLIEALYRQSGAVITRSSDELLDAVCALATTVPVSGDDVGVVSFSGGIRVEFVDLCVEAGFRVPAFVPAVADVVSRLVPSYGSPQNPIDMADGLLADPACAARCVAAVGADGGIDATVVLLTVTRDVSIAERLADAVERSDRPVLVACTSAMVSEEAVALLRSRGIPVYRSPLAAVAALRALRMRREAIARLDDEEAERALRD